MLQQYRGELGNFRYDTDLWEIKIMEDGKESLHWVGGDTDCDLPEGVQSCRGMFKDCQFGERGFTLRDFNTAAVTDMSHMFENCTQWPLKFTIIGRLNTSNVVNMESMFANSIYPDVEILDIDTSHVENMSHMFERCRFPRGVRFGEQFTTVSAVTLSHMFAKASLTPTIEFKECLDDSSNVQDASFMFEGCYIPEGFGLGDKFRVEAIPNTTDMFKDAKDFEGGPLTGSPIEIIQEWYTEAKYEYARILDIPPATLKNCKRVNEFFDVVHKFCRV